MLTYVINTSENKTFECEQLFDLAGYHKIKWIQCSLKDIKACAESIYEKQNVLGADLFRIAVIVDFFNFDRIRLPYGKRGFGQEFGVDMSLYMPYVEIYLMDNLIGFLERKDMLASDFEIYYVQNDKCERYDLLDSAKDQLTQIIKGGEFSYSETRTEEWVEKKPIPPEGRPPLGDEEKGKIESEYERKSREVTDEYYKSFIMYCTSEVSLEFKVADYPYGTDEMTFDQFFQATRRRIDAKRGIRRHYYISAYGGGASRAAFDTLSLSLYLIRMYEREESQTNEGEMEVIHLEATVLKDVIEEAWRKVNAAKIVAKKNELQYYRLIQRPAEKIPTQEERKAHMKEAIANERTALSSEIIGAKMTGEEYYEEVCGFVERSAAEVKDRNRFEFDRIMTEYLHQRDITRENNVEADFKQMMDLGILEMTDQTPSQHDYEYATGQKQQEISDVFKMILEAEYIEVSYDEEKKKADKAYNRYKKAKVWMNRNIIGDIIFMILAVIAMVVPYYTLQLNGYSSKVFDSSVLTLFSIGIFSGLFVCAVLFQVLPFIRRLNKAKKELKRCYIDCYAKERYSFSSIRSRYEKDLLRIEHARYELRQMKCLFEANRAKNENVAAHRNMLEELEDCLSAMLNNLDVEPKMTQNESVDGEFDISKSIRAKENKVYQIFSIETIEKMFPKKGSDDEWKHQ